MNDKMVCRIAKKTKISDKLYTLKTVDYVKDACFTVEEELIYEVDGKTKYLPACVNEEFLESRKTICYIDVVTYKELEEIYGTNDFEYNFDRYVKDCESYATVVFYEKSLDEYEVSKFDIEKFQEFYEFSEASYSFDISEAANIDMVLFFKDKIIFSHKLYRILLDNIKAGNTDVLSKIFGQTEAYLSLIEDNESVKLGVIEREETLSNKTLEEIMEKLNSLVGLDDIKLEVNKLMTYLKFLEKSKEYTNLEKPNLNMVFTGNPGTGKTTVAKIISAILNKLGLANDKILECTAKDFIAGYVGQTAIKTAELINKAKGGVVFIDEAYIFASQSNSFSSEALAEILKEMEKNETVFILSGYKKEMEDFIKLNSGLTSRVGYYFDFKDYSVEQLYQMFELKLKNSKMVMSEDCKVKLVGIISDAKASADFGNGRFIDKLFDNIIIEHAYNTMNSDKKGDLITITSKDINDEVLQQILYKNSTQKKIGF